MLEKFRKAKEAEIDKLCYLELHDWMPPVFKGLRPSFTGSLRERAPLAVIAEYKRASPSKGDINLGVTPSETAEAYARAGAGAISVLTERDYFKGDLRYLDEMSGPGLPLLRKDFILHPLQVRQTASTKASAYLLIVRMLDDESLAELISKGDEYGLEAVVEIFDEPDLARARAAGAKIIQVNNRDLDTLKVDMSLSPRLVAQKQDGEFWITASGINDGEQLRELLSAGFDAALIGSSLMGDGDPGKALAALLGTDSR